MLMRLSRYFVYCVIIELQRMQQISIIYFLYLFIFSGLEFTLTFLTHNRFDFNRYVIDMLFFICLISYSRVV